MDSIMDLTARAISFITLIQDTFMKGAVSHGDLHPASTLKDIFNCEFEHRLRHYISLVRHCEHKQVQNANQQNQKRPHCLESRIMDLVWFSEKAPQEEDKQAAINYLIEVCSDLSSWVNHNIEVLDLQLKDAGGAFSPPHRWQEAVSKLVYARTDQRLSLAEAVEYLPIHLVLALGGSNYEVHEQRLAQWWRTGKKKHAIELTKRETKFHQDF